MTERGVRFAMTAVASLAAMTASGGLIVTSVGVLPAM
jgi:hypothetical protein